MMNDQEALAIGVEAVLYGLPLIMMEHTMRTAVNVESPRGMAAPMNQFAHVRQFPTAAFKQVVRANVDTLYSSAFLDLSAEPLVLSVPDTQDRYYLLPLFDAFTNVVATPGTRTTGSAAKDFLIAGPGFRGAAPEGMDVLRSPTNTVWILGRTQTNGPSDYAAVHAIQDGYTLTPLSAFGKPFAPPKGAVDPTLDMKTPPSEKAKSMSAADYFDMLARLLDSNPPPPADAEMLAKLASIGVVPGQRFDSSKLPVLQNAVVAALGELKVASREVGKVVNGWRIPNMNIGHFGTDYRTRAVIALIAFGANLPDDAVYPTAFVDAHGQALTGTKRYVLHFEAGQLPPVNTFWSITMYDPDSFFVDNAKNRYAISSWMPLSRNPDGSVDLYVQHDSPGEDKEPNWLPAPAGVFNLTLRMYWPTEKPPTVIDGSWAPPAVIESPAGKDER